MGRYILRRILLMIPIVLSVTFVVFFVMNLKSDDIPYMILGPEAKDEQVQALKEELGLDKPLLVRYFMYIRDIVVYQDFGTSYKWNRPVWDDVVTKLPISIKISFFGILIAVAMGVPLGILAGANHNKPIDRVINVFASIISSVPAIWLLMLLMLVLSLKLRLLPSSGIETWKGYVIPCLGLGISYAAGELRYTRTMLLETVRQNYVDTARAKGVPERVVITKHALKNALLPVITLTGSHFGGLIGGAVVCDTMFAMQGLGSFMMSGINNRDTPIACGCIVVLSVVFSLVMLLVDILHALIDPRIKARYAK